MIDHWNFQEMLYMDISFQIYASFLNFEICRNVPFVSRRPKQRGIQKTVDEKNEKENKM